MSIKIGKFMIRPEIEKVLYWIHLVVIAIVVLGILHYFYGGEMFTVKNVLYSVPILGISDILSHSLLSLD